MSNVVVQRSDCKFRSLLILHCSFLIGFFSLFFFSCRSPFDPPKAEQSGGTGVFSLAVNGVRAGRTILPATVQGDFAVYTLEFFVSGTTANPVISTERTNGNLSDPVTINAGTWDLHVTAFMDAEKTMPAARGSLSGIEIPAGGSVNRGVTLNAIMGDGEGTFRWKISYPENVTEASMSIIPLDGSTAEQTVYFAGGPLTDNEDSIKLNTGYYRVVLLLLDDRSRSTGLKEILHVYQNMESVFEYTFTEGHFTYLIVTSGEDSGPESLRAAIDGAPDYGTIIIDESVGTVTLTGGLSINKNLTIIGNGVTITKAPESGPFSLMNTDSGTVTISRMRFKDGSAGSGGAVTNSGTINLESCIFSGNRADNGGAIYSNGTVSVKGCTFYDNSAAGNGGAIYNGGNMVLEGNLFFGNNAQSFPVVYGGGTVTSAGYNAADPLGTGSNESGWMPDATDAAFADLGITGPINTETFKPVTVLGEVILAAPDDFPATDFYGNARTFPGAPGAVAELTIAVTVTFTINDGPAPAQQVTANGNTITEPAVTPKAGHAVDGWYRENDYTEQWNFAEGTVAENITLYAKWEPIPYTITYNSNGASGAVPNDFTIYHIGDTVTVLGNTGSLSRTGCLFAGWNTESGGTGTGYTAGSEIIVGTENIVLYARWVEGYDNSVGIGMVQINAGEFWMGSPENEANRDVNETRHKVTLTYDFFIGMYEITQEQYHAVTWDYPSRHSSNPADGEVQAMRPVEMVTWYDAVEYCNKLSDSEGLTSVYTITNRNPEYKSGDISASYPIISASVTADWSANGYRLPTEAEWEYSCRAGTTTAYNTGIISNDTGWYIDNSDYMTHEVGKKPPNAWGLFDMHGNVWEWCWDRYGSYGSETQTYPVGASSGSTRVFRGGSLSQSAGGVRSARRFESGSNGQGSSVGFRIARGSIVPATISTTGIEMVQINAGTFMMGSPMTEDNRYDNEIQHKVTLTYDFYMGMYEITQEQYYAVTGNYPSRYSKNPVDKEMLRRPVEMVTWYDAVEYCNKLSDSEGLTSVYTITNRNPEYKSEDIPASYPIISASVTADWSANGYRLPTEAEWEYACRAGTTTRWHFGDTESELDNYAWYSANSNNMTHEVGKKPPNAWGLYDMHGNVWEWCWDKYGSYWSEQIDPVGASSGSTYVFRGGSLSHSAGGVRSARRTDNGPDGQGSDAGFRIARGPINNPTISIGIDMVEIPAGAFNRNGYTITLSGFKMGKYEVTQEQYQAVIGDFPSFFSLENDRPPATGEIHDKRPVEQVNWYDAVEFCNALSTLEGLTPAYNINKTTQDPNNTNTDDTIKWTVTLNGSASGYRLPTEAEWEYACRAGTTTAYNTGNTISDDTGWYSANSNNMTHEVGLKPPNPPYTNGNGWGLYDMHGNVWEWCWDWYGSYPSGNQEDPKGATAGAVRVLRGGSWPDSADYTQSGNRGEHGPYSRTSAYGFRLVRP